MTPHPSQFTEPRTSLKDRPTTFFFANEFWPLFKKRRTTMAFLARSSHHFLGAATRTAQRVSRSLGRPNRLPGWPVRSDLAPSGPREKPRCWGDRTGLFFLTVVPGGDAPFLPTPAAHRRGSHPDPGHVWRVSHPALSDLCPRGYHCSLVSPLFYGPNTEGANEGRPGGKRGSEHRAWHTSLLDHLVPAGVAIHLHLPSIGLS